MIEAVVTEVIVITDLQCILSVSCWCTSVTVIDQSLHQTAVDVLCIISDENGRLQLCTDSVISGRLF